MRVALKFRFGKWCKQEGRVWMSPAPWIHLLRQSRVTEQSQADSKAVKQIFNHYLSPKV